MPAFPLLLLGLTAELGFSLQASKQRISTTNPPNPTDTQLVWGWGDACSGNCSFALHIVCHNATCICDPSYPVYLKEKQVCVPGKLLGEDCDAGEQCLHNDDNAICREYSKQFRECDCREDFEIRDIPGLKPPRICFPGIAVTEKDMPTFLGFGLVLSLMSGVICLALRLFARDRFARPRRYANAAIPPPLTVSETYAAFALANTSRDGSLEYRPIGIRSASSSRRPSYTSLHQQRSGSRKQSVGSIRSFRSQSGLILPDLHPEPDHYILYMIRGPSNSLGSDSTTVTTCDSSSSPRTPKSAEQILAIYHSLPEQADGRERGAVGTSHTTSSFRTISSEDVFQEEEEEYEEDDEEELSSEDAANEETAQGNVSKGINQI